MCFVFLCRLCRLSVFLGLRNPVGGAWELEGSLSSAFLHAVVPSSSGAGAHTWRVLSYKSNIFCLNGFDLGLAYA